MSKKLKNKNIESQNKPIFFNDAFSINNNGTIE